MPLWLVVTYEFWWWDHSLAHAPFGFFPPHRASLKNSLLIDSDKGPLLLRKHVKSIPPIMNPQHHRVYPLQLQDRPTLPQSLAFSDSFLRRLPSKLHMRVNVHSSSQDRSSAKSPTVLLPLPISTIHALERCKELHVRLPRYAQRCWPHGY